MVLDLKKSYFNSPIFILTLTILSFTSCSLNSVQTEKYEKIESRKFGVHEVRFEKESPALVSDWYTGSANNWVKFFVLKKSNSKSLYLPIGSEVFIPINLMKKTEPMPEHFIKEWREKNGPPKNTVKKKLASSANSDPLKNEDLKEEETFESLNNDQLIENLIGSENLGQ